MDNLSNLRKRKGFTLVVALAVLLVYSLPFSIFADEKMKQKEAEVVSEGGTYVYDGAGELIPGDTDLKTSATGVVALSKKITKLPTKENPNQFEITLDFKTKSEVKPTSKDTAVVLVVDVSKSMDSILPNSYFLSRIDAAKESLKNFLKQYSENANGAKRMVSIVRFDSNAKVVADWVDVSEAGKISEINNIVERLSTDRDNGGTNLEGGMKLAAYLVKNDAVKDIEKDYRHVVVLTDGVPTINRGNVNESDMTVTGDPWTPTHAIWDSTEKKEKIGIATLENRVDEIQREMEDLNREANTSIFLFSKDMQGEMIIYKNKISQINRIKRYYEIKGSGSITPEQANQLAEELKNNKDKEFSLNSNHEYENMPAGIVMIPNSEEPYYGGYDSHLFWETEDTSYMSGNPKEYWYKNYAGFDDVLSAENAGDLNIQYDNVYKKIVPMPEFNFVDPMGDYIDFLDSLDRKMDYVLKDTFTGGTTNVDITTYTVKYNVVLATDKDGFVDGKHYKTNGTTTVTYKYPDQSDPSKLNEYKVEFPVPEVRGYKTVKTGGGGWWKGSET